jgi:hypothetical protein
VMKRRRTSHCRCAPEPWLAWETLVMLISPPRRVVVSEMGKVS